MKLLAILIMILSLYSSSYADGFDTDFEVVALMTTKHFSVYWPVGVVNEGVEKRAEKLLDKIMIFYGIDSTQLKDFHTIIKICPNEEYIKNLHINTFGRVPEHCEGASNTKTLECYITPDITDYILIHELAHLTLSYYFRDKLTPTMSEIMAQLTENFLRREQGQRKDR